MQPPFGLAQPQMGEIAVAKHQLGQPRNPQRPVQHAQVGQIQTTLADRIVP